MIQTPLLQLRRALMLLLLFFLFALATKPFPIAADVEPEPVLDTSRNKLEVGVDYYILPVERGGGLVLFRNRDENTICPFDVIQDDREDSNGFPVNFFPVEPSKGVRVSTDMNLRFNVFTTCVQPPTWKLDTFDVDYKQWFVTSNGVEGNPGPETISNWFKIQKSGDDYKLVYCPTVCSSCQVLCRDIGTFMVRGKRYLALSDSPLKVKFKRAS